MQFNEKMQGIGFRSMFFFKKKSGICISLLFSWVKRAIIVSNTCNRLTNEFEASNLLHEGKEGGESS